MEIDESLATSRHQSPCCTPNAACLQRSTTFGNLSGCASSPMPVVPENSIRADSRHEAESAHHAAHACNLRLLGTLVADLFRSRPIVTLKNRTLSPAVERFIECAREVSRVVQGAR
jgi:hypothetical protein